MANLKAPKNDEISSASIITELIPFHTSRKQHNSGLESWSCAFSPDESYFVWSSGNSVVTLLPWSFCKHTVFKNKKVTVPFTSGQGILIDSKHDAEDCFGCNTKSINTGHTVHLVLATGHANGRIRTWDVVTGKLILELLDHSDMVSHLAFNPAGNLILVSASYDGALKVWDLLEDGNMFQTLKMNNKPIFSCCWSPDAKTLVSVGMCKLVYVWNMKTMKVKFKLEGHQHDVVSCAFSPDGCLIVSASWDTRVILWDSHNGQILRTFGHLYPSPHLIYACGDNGTWIRDVSFSSDGAHIATVADDGYLRFWDITSEQYPEAIAAVENALCCKYAPSGCILAVGQSIFIDIVNCYAIATFAGSFKVLKPTGFGVPRFLKLGFLPALDCCSGLVLYCPQNKYGSVSFWNAPACIKSLLYLSRISIRKVVSAENVPQLGIPKSLEGYLLYKELE
ncbi:WD repeat and SOCS box-containing protein 1 [Trichonephila inaurata madagascariensis]|uniref:WD repeat and SOCS box-containing protein 1 n=1 Tax=Trichonephila inaurata madagascariensis TaxID=2747483 RepID=A0A8X7BYB8_9ARAC|nr:WD repeat and SOCS box-containing protein 1 [Trichonephila inaurata madagascariensis]